MSKYLSVAKNLFFLMAVVFGLIAPRLAMAADSKIEQDSRAALNSLYAGSPGAKALGAKARGVLAFPKVIKAGLVVGGQGLQAGAQSFGYVLFFMSDKVFNDFRASKNFEIGVGPNIVIVDAGAAKDLNTETAKADVYAMIFDQKGLMAGVGLQGSKITKLKR